MPTPIIDLRKNGDDSPGLHALIIGISRYPFLKDKGEEGRVEQFKLTSVDGPAVSAWKFFNQLQNLPAGGRLIRPLKTARLLLSASEADLQAAPDMAAAIDEDQKRNPELRRIGMPNLREVDIAATNWRQDCETSDDAAAVFFFAGHGLRYDGSDCVVCADFGEMNTPTNIPLLGCLRFQSLLDAMLGPREGYAIARQQFWFVDACRVETKHTTLVPSGRPQDTSMDPRLEAPADSEGRRMQRPGLWSTAAATFAMAANGQGETPFGAALIKAMQAAVDKSIAWPPDAPSGRVWPVTGSAIRRAVFALLRRDPSAKGQVPMPLGHGFEQPLLLFNLNQAPSFDARLLAPPPNLPVSDLSLRRVDGPPPAPIVLKGLMPHPYCVPLRAGMYEVTWTIPPNQTQQQGWFASLGEDEFTLWSGS